MKTTIDIPDELAADAKRVARDGDSTLRELVLAGLRSEIARRGTRPRIDFSFPTQGGRGLVRGVAPVDAIAHSYEDSV